MVCEERVTDSLPRPRSSVLTQAAASPPTRLPLSKNEDVTSSDPNNMGFDPHSVMSIWLVHWE